MTPEQVDLLLSLAERAVIALERRAPHVPSGKDCTALLATLYEAVGDLPFTSVDAMDHVDVAQDEKLAAAIMAVCDGALSPRRLGQALRAVEREPLDGLVVCRAGTSRDGIRWQVLRVSDSHKSASFA